MAEGNSIVVVCKCGKKLKAPATSAGKKVRCPACGAILILPAAPVAVPRSAPKAARAAGTEDDGLGAMYELLEQGNAAKPAVATPRCPQCRSPMESGDVLCTNCGFDTRSGKAVPVPPPLSAARSAAAVAGKKPKQPVDMMAPQGSFIAGLCMSAAFALAASVIWLLVAWFTGFSIGYIAILIGGAAGAGMKVGQKGFSSAGGTAAAGMTLVAILIAKLAVLEALMARHHSHGSIFNARSAALGYYFFSPIGLIIIVVGMAAAYRTANGSVSG